MRIPAHLTRARLGALIASVAIGALSTIQLSPSGLERVQAMAQSLSGPGSATITSGRVMVDGQPFFPFGFFHVTHQGTEADLLNTLRTVSGAGFNTLHAGHLYTVSYGSFLDQAAQQGVRVITEFAMNPTTLSYLISNFAGKPAVLAWNVADDVDDGTKTHDQVLALYRQVKTLDPHHLVSVSGFRAPTEPGPDGITIATFFDVADLPGLQRYPVSYGPVRLVWQAHASTVDAAKGRGLPVLANGQTFNWSNGNGNRYPTPAESRNMTYQSIAAGVKGVLYYAFFDAATNLPVTAPALWAELKTLAPEVKQLAPALLNGQMTRVLADAAGDRFATYWVYDNRVYVVVINTSTSAAKSFSLAMPAGTGGSAQTLFAGRPSGMSLSNGILSGTVQPLDVHVYVLGSPPAAPAGLLVR